MNGILLAALKNEQIKIIFYLVIGLISLVLLLIYCACEKKRKKSSNAAGAAPFLDPCLCAYIKRNGEQCQHEPKNGSRYCALHSRRVLMNRIANAPRQKIYEIEGE